MEFCPNESIIELTSEQTYNMKDEELRKFTCLKMLGLQHNSSITNYGICNLTNLTHLDLSFQRTITIEGLKNLTNLISINLVANGNESITLDELDTLPKLVKVYLKPDQRLFKHAKNTHQLKSHKYELFIDRYG